MTQPIEETIARVIREHVRQMPIRCYPPQFEGLSNAARAILALFPDADPAGGITSNCCIEDLSAGGEPCGPFIDLQKERDELASHATRYAERIAELEKAVADEREACAKLAEALVVINDDKVESARDCAIVEVTARHAAKAIAADIRARAVVAPAQSSTTGVSDG